MFSGCWPGRSRVWGKVILSGEALVLKESALLIFPMPEQKGRGENLTMSVFHLSADHTRL